MLRVFLAVETPPQANALYSSQTRFTSRVFAVLRAGVRLVRNIAGPNAGSPPS